VRLFTLLELTVGAEATDVAVAISGDAAITKVIQVPSSLSERGLEGQDEIQVQPPFSLKKQFLSWS
jgi:Tfp pilus assembly PilM family ATPase